MKDTKIENSIYFYNSKFNKYWYIFYYHKCKVENIERLIILGQILFCKKDNCFETGEYSRKWMLSIFILSYFLKIIISNIELLSIKRIYTKYERLYIFSFSLVLKYKQNVCIYFVLNLCIIHIHFFYTIYVYISMILFCL
jgi:hypothetical protein